MRVTVREISERFSQNIEVMSGNIEAIVTGIASPTSAGPDQMIFVSDKAHIELAKASQSRIWVVKSAIFGLIKDTPHQLVLLKSKDSQLAMALIGCEYFRSEFNKFDFDEQAIHPSSGCRRCAGG